MNGCGAGSPSDKLGQRCPAGMEMSVYVGEEVGLATQMKLVVNMIMVRRADS